MSRTEPVAGRRACAIALACSAVMFGVAAAADDQEAVARPRWMVEIKAGDFTPDLDSFEQFYGDDDVGYAAVSFARGFRPWLEAGAELGYMKETGLGVLSTTGAPGSEVDYTLMPLHLFVNFRGILKPHQLFVPYVGVGLTSAYYREEIELQPDRSGTSDLGTCARLGLQLYLNRFDSDTREGYGTGAVKQTYLFLELQRFSAEQSSSELGGDVFMLGFRFTFGKTP